MKKVRISLITLWALLMLALALWSAPSFGQEATPEATPEATEEADVVVFILSVAGRSCTLAPAVEEDEAEATEEADAEATEVVEEEAEATAEATAEGTEEPGYTLDSLPVYTLGEDCEGVISRLQVPSNGTLWISITLEDGTTLPLASFEDDPYSPTLDRRGSFFGCTIPAEGEQVCHVVVLVENVAFQIDVPVFVGDAFSAPQPTAAPEPTAAPPPDEPPPPPPPPPPATTPDP
jgi:hypothetical protein